MIKRRLAVAFALLLVPVVAGAGSLTQLFVFGDSLSDQGNGYLRTGGTFPPAPYAGRASNGPVAVEYLAAGLGIPLAPSVAGGTNYAVLGAATGPVTFAPPAPPITTDNYAAVAYGQPALSGTGVLAQVQAFAMSGSLFDPGSTLFFVWAGSNDLFINPSQTTAADAVQNLALALGTLYSLGARQFLVPNMPDLALTPWGRSLDPATQAGLSLLAGGFNAGLEQVLQQFDTLPGTGLSRFDSFAFLHEVWANPAAYGFTNATSPCFTGDFTIGATVCADPDSYVFWDGVHPSTATHQILGDRFAEAVAPIPEPTTVGLLGLGLALAAARRRSSAPRE
jgi:outer membrane lipase/esterase